VRQQLKALLEVAAAQQAESSASRQRSERGRAGAPSAHNSNPPPSQQQGRGEGVGPSVSAIKSHLGPNRDARNTIEARRRAESVDNNHVNRSRHNDDRERRRHHDSDDDCECSWSPSQQGHGPLVGASAMRSSPCSSGLRPMCRGTMGTPTPAYGSRTTGSRATPVERPTTSS
jgi:hypothetical protein